MTLVVCAPAPEEPLGPPFREVAAETGLVATHFAGATGKFYLPEIMGSGAALIDYDDDGDLDVFLVQATNLDAPDEGPDGLLLRASFDSADALDDWTRSIGAQTGEAPAATRVRIAGPERAAAPAPMRS